MKKRRIEVVVLWWFNCQSCKIVNVKATIDEFIQNERENVLKNQDSTFHFEILNKKVFMRELACVHARAYIS